jgi:hypothetical protein
MERKIRQRRVLLCTAVFRGLPLFPESASIAGLR